MLIMQVSEELLSHIQQQEIDLKETIGLEMSLGGLSPEISISINDLGMH